MVALSQGDADDAGGLIHQANEEPKTHAFWSHDCHWLSLYASGVVKLLSNDLTEACRLFDETKKYCEAQHEYQIRAFSTRALGEVSYIQKDMPAARGHFEDTVAICEEAGIVPSLLYRSASRAFLNKAPPATYEGWGLFIQGTLPSR